MTRFFRLSGRLLLLAAVLAPGPGAFAQQTLVSSNSTWRYRQGTNEVSSPLELWRSTNYSDSAWAAGTAPFHYGTNSSGGDDTVVTGTILGGMSNSYSCLFFRNTFVITNLAEVASLQMVATCDDGFIAWINGVEALRTNVSGQPTYTALATGAREASPAVTLVSTNLPQSYLVGGTNILAVQAFNVTKADSDFRFDAALQFTKRPLIVGTFPAAGATVGSLTQITVIFNEPVVGVNASDLLVNGQPAPTVSGGAVTNIYTFTLTQPLPGPVVVTWDDTSAISDPAGNPFNTEGPTANWSYTLIDNMPPQVSELTPAAAAQVSRLTQVEVSFSEPVLGLDASDLLINGLPAASVVGADAGPYVFQFPQPASGAVQFSWAAGHSVTDASPAANPFAGGSWTVNFNPGVSSGDVIVNEFLAANLTGLNDEDGEAQDWIELYNRGTDTVNLLGWSLTDNNDTPGKWTFPSTVLNPGQFLVIFASGKDRRAPIGTNLFHTNFKLNAFGNSLALFNAESPRAVAGEFAPTYPEQRTDYSYGLDGSNVWRYFKTPTPGGPNGNSTIVGLAPETHFSVGRGVFDTSFNLLLTTPLPGATIRYTTDGSEPTDTNGLAYAGSLLITNTAILRAAVFLTNYLPSRTRTESYIFLDSVLTQPNNPPGFPNNWGTTYGNNVFSPASSTPGFVPADYGMDTDPLRVDPNNSASAVDPVKLQRFRNGLGELPIVSIALKRDDMFGPNGIYNYPNVVDKNFADKKCSVEMILPDGSTAFEVTCGIGAHGGASREPLKNPKHGLKLSFKGDFGEGSLSYQLFPDGPATEFDDIILRPDFNTSWRHWSDSANNGNGPFQRSRATRTRAAWSNETLRDMGDLAPHSRFCHLFIDGLYWGTYDFIEQPSTKFAEAYYGGGTSSDFDIYEAAVLNSGTSTAYDTMIGIAGLANNANYELIKQYLDVTDYIDYTLLHFFIGHQDWGSAKNWYAIRKRVSGPLGAFKWFPWDQESILLDENENRVPPSNPTGQGWPADLEPKLEANAQFRLDFADRVFKHMLAPGGALTTVANTARWQKWLAILDKPIVAESARWGDYRRDVHQYSDGTYVLYTRENQWLAESNRMVTSYFVNRPGIVLGQLRAAGLYPGVDAPSFNQQGGRIPAGFNLTMTVPAGTIYYTTNGVDPRVYYAGTVSSQSSVYVGPLPLTVTVAINARAFSGTNWSALNEATFAVGEPGVPLRITEIMYNPIGGDAYEFVEVRNIGATPVDAGGFSFDGIGYIFPDNTVIQPGATLLLSSGANTNAFHTRYPSVSVYGAFSGSLDNGGERLAIVDRNGQTVTAVHYDDEAGWPTAADGAGFSLEIIDPRGDPNAPDNWRASAAVNGTPGLPPITPAPGSVVLNEVMADNLSAVTNGGVFPDWVELYNSGTNSVNLTSWSLTDDSSPRKFVLPSGTTLPAGGYLAIWCDSATNAPGLHTGFALGRSGDTVLLYDANTNRVDAITFGLQLADHTIGRVGNDWQLTYPTPNASNTAVALASSTNIAINEWLASPGTGGADWIELFNRSSNAPVSLRGLYLSTSNTLFRIGALSFLPPRGYAQLFADENAGADHLEFKLPAAGGAIVLYDATAIELERVTYGLQTPGVSEGRLPDGTSTITSFPGSVSPGAGNYLLVNSGPVLNEVLARNQRATVTPWGAYADWVELYNPGATSADLSGMALGKSVSDRWTFPAGAGIPAGQYLLVWCDGSQPASTNNGPTLNTGFSLGGNSGDVFLFNGTGQAVDSISYGFQLPDQSIGRSGGGWRLLSSPTPAAANSAAAPPGSATALRINEWMASPLAGNAWFELYNAGALPVDMGGLFLTDDPSSTGVTKSPIAPLSFIGAGQWVKWEADGSVAKGRNHTNFQLDRQGETLRLYDTNLTLIDVVDFGIQADGVSQGRLPDGAANIVSFPTTPTPEESNYLPLTNVVINEVLSHTDPPLEDAIELHNPSGAPANIGGWFLSDSQSDLKRYRIPNGTAIPAGGYQVFYQYQFGPADGEQDSPPLFTFNSAHGDEAYLSEADINANLTGYRAGVTFGASANGVSFGRYQTSVGVDFVAMRQSTFGVDNPADLTQFRTGAGLSNAYPRVGPIVINELMYHPPSSGTNVSENPNEEFIELFNFTTSPVPLFDPAHPTNVWRLANAVTFNFPANMTIPSGGFLLVVPFDPAVDASALTAFQAVYGANGTLVGPYSGKLDNSGESVELYRPDTPQAPSHSDAGFVPYILVDRVQYSNAAPWPTNADGGGASLQRINATAYGNDPANWTALAPTAGRPAANADTDGDGLPDVWEMDHGTGLLVPDADLDPDQDGMSNWQEFLAGTDPQSAQSYLRLDAVIESPGEVTLEFQAVSNHTYSVLYKDSLDMATWSRLADVESRGTNRLGAVMDLIAVSTNRFYRLVTPQLP